VTLSILYFNSSPKVFGVKIELDDKIYGHCIKKELGRAIISPTSFSNENISLKNLNQLKKKLNILQIYMFDRIFGLNKNVLINDHINRSGVSFLRGETPYNKKPMFPDLSMVYSGDPKKQGVVVQTLGPERFKQPPNEPGAVFSESAAIIATLWYYIGVEVVCFGIGKPNQTILELI
tara:strand:- start:1002 stop:1532 length:531 start_codon:yes stop_codon:yes gene_type:complete